MAQTAYMELLPVSNTYKYTKIDEVTAPKHLTYGTQCFTGIHRICPCTLATATVMVRPRYNMGHNGLRHPV